jgi:hypothetical protein
MSTTPAPSEVLLGAAIAADKLGWLIFAAKRIGQPVNRYRRPGGGFSYTLAALDLAEAGVTWSRIGQWKA